MGQNGIEALKALTERLAGYAPITHVEFTKQIENSEICTRVKISEYDSTSVFKEFFPKGYKTTLGKSCAYKAFVILRGKLLLKRPLVPSECSGKCHDKCDICDVLEYKSQSCFSVQQEVIFCLEFVEDTSLITISVKQ